jgi:hypothetical protein
MGYIEEVANRLDELGMHNEADMLDEFIGKPEE